ncbi:hypothetical protein Ssi03_01470 [Sphaerisporangium siamense]|nr:hypothetical protein Ssi03_01470 [Sphaerisporangium siamense]
MQLKRLFVMLVGLCTALLSAIVTTAPPAAASADGLVAAYGFDGSPGDSSGNGNHGITLSPTWEQAGKFGQALSLNGSHSTVVSVPDSPSLRVSGAFTLEAWVRPDDVEGWRTILLKQRSGGLSYALYAHSSWFVSDGENSVTDEDRLPVDTWSHVASTYDGEDLRFYVNGTLIASSPAAGSVTYGNGELSIGGNWVWGEYFTGLLDELRIYDVALTAAQIQSDMTTPINEETGPDDPPSAPGTLTVTGADSATLQWGAASDDHGVASYEVHRSVWRDFVPRANTRVALVTGTTYTELLAVGTHYYRVVPRDTTGKAGPPSNQAIFTRSQQGLAAAYGLNDHMFDASGHDNSGQLYYCDFTDTGRFGQSIAFDGTNSLFSTWDNPFVRTTDAFTLEAWVRPSELSGSRPIITKARANGQSYALYTDGARFTSDTEKSVASPVTLPLDTWSHVAATYDGATLRFYVNGEEVASAPASGKPIFDSGLFRVGGDPVRNEHFAGLIDEVRVYNIALTPARVQSDMTIPLA